MKSLAAWDSPSTRSNGVVELAGDARLADSENGTDEWQQAAALDRAQAKNAAPDWEDRG